MFLASCLILQPWSLVETIITKLSRELFHTDLLINALSLLQYDC